MTDKTATQTTETAAAPVMVDMFTNFAVDSAAAKEGKWIPYKGGVEFLIARDGNPRHRRALMQYWKANPGTEVTDEEDMAQIEQRDAEILAASKYGAARAILLGWKGPLAFGGVALDYSIENAEKLLAMDDFADWVSRQSATRANYAAKIEAANSKN